MGTMLSNAEVQMLLAAAEVWEPPPPVDLEAWACRNIVFSARESQYPGPYNTELFPFFSEVLKALGPDDPCRFVTFKKSAQVGGTVLATIFVLGIQALDPCDFLYVHPTEDNAARWSKLKLKPMLRGTPAVARFFPERSRDGGDSILFKERSDGRGSILISGANSPASLSQVSMPRQIQDDLSKWQPNEAGNPEQQADSRSRGYEFAKLFKISTPLVSPGCKITRNFEAGSQEVYLVPCPHCGFEHALEWENMLANLDEKAPEDAHFTCPDCGGVIEQHHRHGMVSRGRWHARNPQALRYHRSFDLWSAYAPLQSWETVAREWFKAKGDPASERVFLNDTVGRAYDAKGDAPPWESLRDRAEQSEIERGHLPAWAVLVSAGIDVQKDRVEWQVIGWGRDFRRHVVDAGVITGHVSEAQTQAAMDGFLGLTFRHASGRQLGIDIAAIDGNAWTEDVWSWAKRHPKARLIMVRGVGAENAPLIARVKRERNRRGMLLKYASRFYNIGASVLKMGLYRNVTKTDPMERGFVSFPRGLPEEYFRQLTAESRQPVKRRDGYTDWKWVKDPNQANEMLDTMVQAEAAAIKIGLREMNEKVWDRLEAERAAPLQEAQMDMEDMLTPVARGQASPPSPPALPRRGRGVRSKGVA